MKHMAQNHLTPYPEIDTILNVLLQGARAILEDQFKGMYLHGSLASGDFNLQTSDIDFLVVTNGSLSAETFMALKKLHAHLFSSGLAWSQKLEGAYIPQEDLRHHDSSHAPIPWLGVDGHFALERLGSDWTIQRWILREKGLVVAGPPPKPMIDFISPDDLREAVRCSLREWWSPPFPFPERFQSGEYQAYAVLTMCRSLYTLKFGRITSKPEAARWALEIMDEPWTGLISAAATWQPGTDFKRLNETLEFILFTLEKWGISSKQETGKAA